MTLPGPLTLEDLRLHWWTLELSLEASSIVFLRTIEDVTIELNDTPWWRPFKKRALRQEWGACWRLSQMFQEYADQLRIENADVFDS